MRELSLGDRLRRADSLLLGLAVAFSLLGVVCVRTASADVPGDAAAQQLRWVVIGVAACLLTLATRYTRIVSWRWGLYAGGLALLFAVLIIGVGTRTTTARRWIPLGAFKVQPSEFMKVIMVVALAGHIRYGSSHREWRGLAIPFLLTLAPLLLIMKQPDLGTALLLIPLLFVLLYVAGARPRHLGIVAVAGVFAGLFLYFTPGLLNEYQKDRVRAFVHQGSGDKALLRSLGHQLHNSKIVVGSATAFGVGTGQEAAEDVQFLDERHTDFIFPVLLTSFGTVGATGFLLLYLFFVWRLLYVARRVREPAGRLLAVGTATLFACQAIINMAMTVGLLPIVGMPLPFISKGGSSLLTSFLALGLVLNAAADPPLELGGSTFEFE